MNNNGKAWIISVSMGYGHQRTAYPLRDFGVGGKTINANDYQGIPKRDKRIWESTRIFYEFMSDFKKIPLVGDFSFYLYNKFQEIPAFYPKRDLSKPTFSLKKIFSVIKKGWGKDLVQKLELNNEKLKERLPLITTFFTPAFMAEEFGYSGEIFCVICDADISRAWAPLDPGRSRIKYLAPNSWVADRLTLYGVKPKNIFLAGYPLPLENIGSERMEIVKNDFGQRLLNLDPKKQYLSYYSPLVEKYAGDLRRKMARPPTLMFSIGGAGAQKEIAIKALKSLKSRIKDGEMKMILSVGVRKELKDYFFQMADRMGIGRGFESGLEILFAENIAGYFQKFNQALRKTDVLWTKPSELSFYSALGLPVIVAPTIGSQEDFNRKWLLRIGSGLPQENPKYISQWFFDCLEGGRFAEAAMQGFVEIEKMGVYNIKKICFGGADYRI